MTVAAIIVAAGRGTRAGGDLPKQWQMLAGRPVVAHTLDAFAGLLRVLVIHPDDRARAEPLGVPLVEGGGQSLRIGPRGAGIAGRTGGAASADP